MSRRNAGLALATAALTVWLLTVAAAPIGGHVGRIDHFVEDWRGAVQYVRENDPHGRHPVFLWAGLIEADELGTDGDSTLPPKEDYGHRGDAAETALPATSDAQQQALRRYLLFPISGLYDLDDGRTLLPLTPGETHWLTAADVRSARDCGGAWLIFRSPEVERLALEVTEELTKQGVAVRVTHRRALRGLAVIHVLLG
jgi:hypothetical protein